MLRLLLGIFSPLVKLLGVSALTEAMDALRAQFDAIEQRQAAIEARLAEVEKKNNAVFHGWELMSRARAQLPHADAADPHPPGETLQDRARRVGRHVEPKEPDKYPYCCGIREPHEHGSPPEAANVEGDEEEPPPEHV